MELLLDNLCKDFGGNTAVAGITAVLEPGIYGLLGANGAGKTTLLRMICGVLKPTAGQVRLDGIPIDTLGVAYRDKLGTVERCVIRSTAPVISFCIWLC